MIGWTEMATWLIPQQLEAITIELTIGKGKKAYFMCKPLTKCMLCHIISHRILPIASKNFKHAISFPPGIISIK